MSINRVTDRDCINLSELVYQQIEELGNDYLYNIFYDQDGYVKSEIKHKFPDYAKDLSTFPDYYTPTFEKYKLLEVNSTSSGYYGAAFFNTKSNEIVLANRGTVLAYNSLEALSQSLKDLFTDFKMGVLGKTDQQFCDANEFCKHIIKLVEDPDKKLRCMGIILTGHSLGGAQAVSQFISFYTGQYNLLQRLVTFEAPGMERVLNNAEHQYKTDVKDEYAKVLKRGSYLFNKSRYTQLITQYGTHLDWIYNGTSHVGNTIDPLTRDGIFVPADKIESFEKRGLAIKIFHSISTYKIYGFKDEDTIAPGQLNPVNFYKFILPLLTELGLNHEQIISLAKKMYNSGFQSVKEIDEFFVKEFNRKSIFESEDILKSIHISGSTVCPPGLNKSKNFLKMDRAQYNIERTMGSYKSGALADYDSIKKMCEYSTRVQPLLSIFTELYVYNQYLACLKGIMNESYFITVAQHMLNGTEVPEFSPEKSEWEKRIELERKIADFEFKYDITDLGKIRSIAEIPGQALSPTNSDELEVLEHLFDYLSDNAGILKSIHISGTTVCPPRLNKSRNFRKMDRAQYKMQEEAHAWIYKRRYEKFCEEHKDFFSRKFMIDSLLSELKTFAKQT